MYNALLAFIAILSAALITFLFLLIYTVVGDYELEKILWLAINLLAVFCSIWGFSWVYKKAYGQSMFQKTISDIKHKEKRKVDSEGIIYVKSEKSVRENSLEIWLIVVAMFILIINVFSEDLRTRNLYITTGVLCLISFMVRLFHERKEISANLENYAHSYLFAGIVYYKRWYQLPAIKKVGISNSSFVEMTSEHDIARSTNRVVQYRLFLRFYDTNETLTLLYADNVDTLKKERDQLREKIKN